MSMSMKFSSAMPRVFVSSPSLLFCLISEKTVSSRLALVVCCVGLARLAWILFSIPLAILALCSSCSLFCHPAGSPLPSLCFALTPCLVSCTNPKP